MKVQTSCCETISPWLTAERSRPGRISAVTSLPRYGSYGGLLALRLGGKFDPSKEEMTR